MFSTLWETVRKQWPLLEKKTPEAPDALGSLLRAHQVDLLEACLDEKKRDRTVMFLNSASAYAYVLQCRRTDKSDGDKKQILPSPPSSPLIENETSCLAEEMLLILDDIRIALSWFEGEKRALPIPQVLKLARKENVRECLKATKESIQPVSIERVQHMKPVNGTMLPSGKHFELQIFPGHVLVYLLPKKKSSPCFSCISSHNTEQQLEDDRRFLFEWALDDDYDLFAYPTFPTTLEIRFLSKQCVLLVDCPSKEIRDGLCAYKTKKSLLQHSHAQSVSSLMNVKVARTECKWLKLLPEESIPCMAYRFAQGVHGSGLSCTMAIKLIKNSSRPYLALVVNREETGSLLVQMKLATLIDFNAIHNLRGGNNGKNNYPRLILGGINEARGEPEMWTFKFTCQSDLELVERTYRLWVKRLMIEAEKGDCAQLYLDTMTGVDGKQPKPGAVLVNNRDASLCLQVFSDYTSTRYIVIGSSTTTVQGVFRIGYKLYDAEATTLEGFVELVDADNYRNLKMYTSRFILQNDPRLISTKALEWLKCKS